MQLIVGWMKRSKRRVRTAHAASFSRITDHLAWINRPISNRRVRTAHAASFSGSIQNGGHESRVKLSPHI